MSLLTALSAARMQEFEILRTRCADCGHRMADHPISARNPSPDNPACRGEMKTGNRPRCKCKGFAEPVAR